MILLNITTTMRKHWKRSIHFSNVLARNWKVAITSSHIATPLEKRGRYLRIILSVQNFNYLFSYENYLFLFICIWCCIKFCITNLELLPPIEVFNFCILAVREQDRVHCVAFEDVNMVGIKSISTSDIQALRMKIDACVSEAMIYVDDIRINTVDPIEAFEELVMNFLTVISPWTNMKYDICWSLLNLLHRTSYNYRTCLACSIYCEQ